jgi:hypothetical protein
LYIELDSIIEPSISEASVEFSFTDLIDGKNSGTYILGEGDVFFDKNLQRTINVDIRFVLYIIDKYAGAKHIIDELTIVE